MILIDILLTFLLHHPVQPLRPAPAPAQAYSTAPGTLKDIPLYGPVVLHTEDFGPHGGAQ